MPLGIKIQLDEHKLFCNVVNQAVTFNVLALGTLRANATGYFRPIHCTGEELCGMYKPNEEQAKALNCPVLEVPFIRW